MDYPLAIRLGIMIVLSTFKNPKKKQEMRKYAVKLIEEVKAQFPDAPEVQNA